MYRRWAVNEGRRPTSIWQRIVVRRKPRRWPESYLDDLGTLEERLIDLKLGQFHGYPSCCVYFYMHEWAQMPPDARRARIDSVSRRVGYIECPRCLERGAVPTRLVGGRQPYVRPRAEAARGAPA